MEQKHVNDSDQRNSLEECLKKAFFFGKEALELTVSSEILKFEKQYMRYCSDVTEMKRRNEKINFFQKIIKKYLKRIEGTAVYNLVDYIVKEEKELDEEQLINEDENKKYQSLNEEIDKLKKNIEKREDFELQLRIRIEKLEKDNTDIGQETDLQVADITVLREENFKLQKENSVLREEIDKLSTENSVLSTENSVLREEIDKLSTENSKILEKIILSTENSKLLEENSKLLDENTTFINENIRLREENSVLNIENSVYILSTRKDTDSTKEISSQEYVFSQHSSEDENKIIWLKNMELILDDHMKNVGKDFMFRSVHERKPKHPNHYRFVIPAIWNDDESFKIYNHLLIKATKISQQIVDNELNLKNYECCIIKKIKILTRFLLGDDQNLIDAWYYIYYNKFRTIDLNRNSIEWYFDGCNWLTKLKE